MAYELTFQTIYDIGKFVDDGYNFIIPYFIYILLLFLFLVFLIVRGPELRTISDYRFYHAEGIKTTGYINDYKPIQDSPEYKQNKETQYYAGAKKQPEGNKIKLQYQSRLSKSDRMVLTDIQRKKNNLIRMKDKFIQGSSEQEYSSRLQEFDAQTQKISDRVYLESQVYSMLHPVLEAPATPKRVSHARASKEEYDKYIHSPLWRRRSKKFRESKMGVCDICHQFVGTPALQTHHKGYPDDLIMNDNPSFWTASCRKCHNKQEGEKP